MTSTLSAPVTSTADVAERVREAAARHAPMRIVGAGTWLDANRPVPQDAAPLPLAALSGIVEYEPGDLTLTARAGTSLGEIVRATAAHDQWLTLDPHGADEGTIGATVATASAGPLAHAFGTPRDLVLGVEFVTGKGAIARGGGRVVKNVAGFDLTRLLTGSWGSLGIVTEVAVRLRARPEVDRTVAVAIADEATAPETMVAWLRAVPATPLAFELLDATLARRLDVGDGATVLARLAGNEADVRAFRDALGALGDLRDADASAWRRLRVSEPAGAAVARYSDAVSAFGGTWRAARAVALRCPGAFVHATPGRGTARVVLSPASDDDVLRQALEQPFGGTRVYERLPRSLWPRLAPSRVMDRLSRGVKRAYDPDRLLNPGILGEDM